MKKILSILMAVVMVFSVTTVLAESETRLFLNGEKLEPPVPPMIVNDRTMVPFRIIFEALGIEVNWNDANKMVYAMSDDVNIVLTIGSNKMVANSSVVELDAAPFISNGNTLVPARAVCEALGCTVEWDGESRSVIIRTADYTGPAVPDELLLPPAEEVVDNTEIVTPNDTQIPPVEYTPIIDDVPAYINKNNSKLPSQVIDLINESRVANNLDPLIADANISAVAQAHSKDMADNDYIGHTSLAGITYYQRLDMAGIYYVSAAETLASGFVTADEVVRSWFNSPAHRENILNFEFTHIGVGYYPGGSNGTYWTMILISR